MEEVEVAVAVVEEREKQKLLALVPQHVVVEDLVRLLAFTFGDGPNTLLRPGLVVRRIAEGEDLFQHELVVEHAAESRGIIALGAQDASSNVRVPHAAHALREREILDLEIGGTTEELVRFRLMTGEDTEGARRELRHDVGPALETLMTDIDEFAPLLGRGVELKHRERNRSLDLRGKPLHPIDLLECGIDRVSADIARGPRAGEFEHAFAEIA